MSGGESPGPDALPPATDLFLKDEAARLRLVAMTAMAGALAHDLIDPLSAAMNFLHGCSRLLRTQQDAERVLPMLEQAGEQTLKAVAIIRRMRTFIADGRVDRVRHSLTKMLDRVRSNLVLDGRLDGELAVAVDPAADLVLADRLLFETALTNLIVNALEAMEGRDVRRVEIESSRRDGEVEILVRDSGPGLPDALFGRLFDPSFSTRPGSAGLGLPICKAIVEAHGGRIWAEPFHRGGAVFRIALPAAAS